MRNFFNGGCAILFFGVVLMLGCEPDSMTEFDEEGSPIPPASSTRIVSGDPALNNFVITSKDESVVTVNAETGQDTEVYTFEANITPKMHAAFANGNIFVTTDDNSINALSMANNSFLWDAPMLEYNNSYGYSEPVCIDGVCYAVGTTGVVVALDAVTGAVKWHYTTDPDGDLDYVLNDADTPIVHGNKVYVISDEGYLNNLPAYIHVLDKQTGQLLQKIELPYETTGRALFNGNTLYLPAKNLYAINIDTFDIIWQLEAEKVGNPSISGDRLVVSATIKDNFTESYLFCIDTNSADVLWQVDTGSDFNWSNIIEEDVVFGLYHKASSFPGDASARPFAVSLSDGGELWYREWVVVRNNPVYANGRLFFHGHDIRGDGEDTDDNLGFLSMDANTGDVLWLNSSFRPFLDGMTPIVIAQNGVFGPSYYRDK